MKFRNLTVTASKGSETVTFLRPVFETLQEFREKNDLDDPNDLLKVLQERWDIKCRDKVRSKVLNSKDVHRSDWEANAQKLAEAFKMPIPGETNRTALVSKTNKELEEMRDKKVNIYRVLQELKRRGLASKKDLALLDLFEMDDEEYEQEEEEDQE